MKRVLNPVPMAEAKQRALDALGEQKYVKASAVAWRIWPDATFLTSQGAGAAASRILKALEKDGRVKWSCASDRSDWGYRRR